MSGNFLGIGWKFPVRVDDDRKIVMSVHEEDIKESIWIILSTAKGERIMRPDFGCDIHELVFTPINTAMMNMIEIYVRDALTLWEPRIEVLRVEASPEQSDHGKLRVSVDYRIRLTNTRENLVYPFYLKEGA